MAGRGGDAGDEDDVAVDELCEANTLHNVSIPVAPPGDAGSAVSDKLGRRLLGGAMRRVTFDEQPPSVRYFEPASPEPIVDPEMAARDGGEGGAQARGAATPAAPAV